MKDKWDHFEEKFAKFMQFVLADCLGQIRIRYNYSGFRSELAKILRSDPIQIHITGSRSNETFYFMQPYNILKCFCIVPRHLCMFNRIWIQIRIEVKCCLLTRIRLNAMQLVFGYGSRSSVFGQCRSGSRSRVFMTKNWEKFTAEKKNFCQKLQFTYP